MTADQRQARKCFDGVLMAYQDCAEIAEAIADKQKGFVAVGMARGVSQHDAEMAAAAGETMARSLADSFRAKMEIVKAMIDNAPKDPGKVAGGYAAARKLSPEQRAERGRHAANARWKRNCKRELALNAANAKIEKLREALDEIFTRISYINIHGVGEQPETTGIPQPMRASPDEFRRIWQEIGNLAGAALDETK